MTDERIIEILERRSTIPSDDASWEEIMEAIDEAIEIIKDRRLNPIDTTRAENISSQIFDLCTKNNYTNGYDADTIAKAVFRKCISEDSSQHEGHWIRGKVVDSADDKVYICSECGNLEMHSKYDICPKCCAIMSKHESNPSEIGEIKEYIEYKLKYSNPDIYLSLDDYQTILDALNNKEKSEEKSE